MGELTQRRGEVLRMIHEFRVRVGWAPSLQEIADAFGWESKHSAALHVERLALDGYLRKGRGGRTLAVTSSGLEWLGVA